MTEEKITLLEVSISAGEEFVIDGEDGFSTNIEIEIHALDSFLEYLDMSERRMAIDVLVQANALAAEHILTSIDCALSCAGITSGITSRTVLSAAGGLKLTYSLADNETICSEINVEDVIKNIEGKIPEHGRILIDCALKIEQDHLDDAAELLFEIIDDCMEIIQAEENAVAVSENTKNRP